MSRIPDDIDYLWRQYLSEKATAGELDRLFRYIRDTGNDSLHAAAIRKHLSGYKGIEHWSAATQSDIVANILQRYKNKDLPASQLSETQLSAVQLPEVLLPQPELPETQAQAANTRRLVIRRWMSYAAAVIFIVITVAVYSIYRQPGPGDAASADVAAAVPADVEPGKEGALLTLADGTVIVLDGLDDGLVASQGGANVVLNEGQLAYDAKGNDPARVVYNVISTPKGRQFHIQLPDGTHAWLNSASSIRFPSTFIGKERVVDITGEIYFEVAKNKEASFKVQINEDASVEVLGTHFNVNAYEDEGSIQTTLLEGAVRMRFASQTESLTPGQRARTVGQGMVVDKSPNLDQIMAWTKGLFIFDDDDVYTVMRQLERWYDIQVRFEGERTEKQYNGKIQRNLKLSQILKVLEGVGIHVRLEGERMLVVST